MKVVGRWRQGEPPTADHLHGLARLVAVTDIISRDHMITNVASWMEVPLCPPCPFSGIDLVVTGHFDDLVDLAGQHATPESVLDRVLPDWRDSHTSEFEVFEADDGETGIRPASPVTD